jgi:hypothetical protein
MQSALRHSNKIYLLRKSEGRQKNDSTPMLITLRIILKCYPDPSRGQLFSPFYLPLTTPANLLMMS